MRIAFESFLITSWGVMFYLPFAKNKINLRKNISRETTSDCLYSASHSSLGASSALRHLMLQGKDPAVFWRKPQKSDEPMSWHFAMAGRKTLIWEEETSFRTGIREWQTSVTTVWVMRGKRKGEKKREHRETGQKNRLIKREDKI